MYKIVCFWHRGSDYGHYTVPGLTGLTLEQAQEICTDPETSSKTGKGKSAQRRNRKYDAWFFGYTEM